MKGKLQKMCLKSKVFLRRNSPTILTVVAGIGMVATAVSAVMATPKAMKRMEDVEDEKERKLTVPEKVVAAAPAYIPSAIMGLSTVVCIFGANVLNKKQRAALASAYTLAAGNYTAYKNKVKDVYGKDAHERILKSIAVEKADTTPIYAQTPFSGANLDFEGANEEELLFYDIFSNRYFQSTISKVLQAEYHLNRNFVLGGVVSLNDFYEFLGLEKTEYGEIVGWNYHDEIYWIDFDHSKTTTDDGLEIYLIESIFEPTAEALTED